MKKAVIAVVAAAIVIAVIWFLTDYYREKGNISLETTTAARNIEDNESQKSVPQSTTPSKATKTPNETTTKPLSERESTSTANSNNLETLTGKYLGQSGESFIRVQINTPQQGKVLKMISLSEELKSSFANLGLKKGDNISFEYFSAENGAYVIVSIEKIAQ